MKGQWAALFGSMLLGLLGTMMLCSFPPQSLAEGALRDYPIKLIPLTEVELTDGFWSRRREINRTVTIPHNLRELKKQGSFGGFKWLAGDRSITYHGWMWGDSDVYKTLEGIVYSLQTQADPILAGELNRTLTAISKAQAPNGYLFPHLQITQPDYQQFSRETTGTCESYSQGHLIELAVAHYRATGQSAGLNTAKRAADLLAKVQAEGKWEQISGHPGIELALIKLYQATGNRNYFELAKSYVANARTHASAWSRGKPFLGHDDAVGHAVAAVYLYCGATDVAALSGNADLLALLERKWQRIVSRKIYLTGGIGLPEGEAFGVDYDLPNAGAYAETCAAIAQALWNIRLFRAHGDAKYLDVLEIVLYNGFLAGVGLSGDRFFYPNPLAADGRRGFNRGNTTRTPWFGCPCCPVNVVRFLPQIPGLMYATNDNTILVNLFAAGKAHLRISKQPVQVTQQTRYPWEGKVTLKIDPEHTARFEMRLRLPTWSRICPLPSNLYRYAEARVQTPELKVNGQPADWRVDRGFAVVDREWQSGDELELVLPMPVRRVVCHPAVKENVGRVAIMRGPILYCAEARDQELDLTEITLPDRALLAASWQPNLLQGVVTIKASVPPSSTTANLALIPYYAWNHRSNGAMTVWIPH